MSRIFSLKIFFLTDYKDNVYEIVGKLPYMHGWKRLLGIRLNHNLGTFHNKKMSENHANGIYFMKSNMHELTRKWYSLLC